MNWKQILGAIAIVIGVAFFIIAHSIEGQLDDGREQIARGQEQVDKGKSLFSGNPVTKEVSNQVLFKPAERKIRKGKEEISYYENISKILTISGVISLIIGAGSIFVFRKR